MFYIFSAENPGFILDISEGKWNLISAYWICLSGVSWSYTIHFISDISNLNNLAVAANSTGMIALGGGVAKHQLCNANAWVSILHYFIQNRQTNAHFSLLFECLSLRITLLSSSRGMELTMLCMWTQLRSMMGVIQGPDLMRLCPGARSQEKLNLWRYLLYYYYTRRYTLKQFT